jgi:hypothetical protein
VGCIRRLFSCLTTLILLAVLLAVCAYFFLLEPMRANLADAVRRKFMLPPSSTVTITPGSYIDALSGHVKAFHVESSEASISKTSIEDLKLDAENINFDIVNLALQRNPILREVGHAKVSFTITPESLAGAWLARVKHLGVKKLTLKLEEGTGEQLPLAQVNATVDILGKEIPLAVKGFFKLVGKREIGFEATEFRLQDFGIGGDFIQNIFMKFAPKVRIGDFQGDLTIDRFYVLGGKLHVVAQTTGVTSLAEDAAPPKDKVGQ